MKTKIEITLLCAIVAASTLFHFYSDPHRLNYNDAPKYADVARNIKEGKGLATDFIYPEYFRYFKKVDDHPWHSYWPPLYPIFLAAGFFIFGVNDVAAIYVTAILFLVSAWLVYLLAKKIFDRGTALIATVFYACTQEMLWYRTSGLSEPLYICFLLLCIYPLYDAEKINGIFLSGVSLGLAVMTRNAALLWLPVLLFFIYLSQAKDRRIKFIIYFTLGIFLTALLFYAIIIPFLGGHHTSKNLLLDLLLFNTESYPGGQIMRSLDNIDLPLVQKYFPLIVKKMQLNAKIFFGGLAYSNASCNNWSWIYTLMPAFLMIPYVLSLFKPPIAGKRRLMHYAVFASFLILAVLSFFTTMTPEMRYFHPFVPLFIIFAVGFIMQIWDRLFSNLVDNKIYLNIVLAALIVYFLIPDMIAYHISQKEVKKVSSPAPQEVLADALARVTNPQDIVVTNLDAWGSWYGRRKAIYYPITPADLSRLARFTEIDALLLFDNLFFDEPSALSWSKLIREPKDFDDFYFVKVMNIPLNAKESIVAALYRRK